MRKPAAGFRASHEAGRQYGRQSLQPKPPRRKTELTLRHVPNRGGKSLMRPPNRLQPETRPLRISAAAVPGNDPECRRPPRPKPVAAAAAPPAESECTAISKWPPPAHPPTPRRSIAIAPSPSMSSSPAAPEGGARSENRWSDARFAGSGRGSVAKTDKPEARTEA